jgi:hypothetical protein
MKKFGAFGGVVYSLPAYAVPVKLYNLLRDIGETDDLVAKEPEKVKELARRGGSGTPNWSNRCGVREARAMPRRKNDHRLASGGTCQRREPSAGTCERSSASITVSVMSMPGATTIGISAPGCDILRCRLVGL